MKKILNKKFILILMSAITLLVILVVAMILLTKENTKSFSRSGYIIATAKEDASTKYYFDEGTDYKTNISSQLVFTDTSGEKVNVETDNFLHYTDGGIKFLKNGVIMDLDSVNSTIVPYYNITNKAVLEYSQKSYYIETIDKTLAFNNIIGRISENKYIVAGANVKLQLSGNNDLIEGDYFEITYIEEGVIKVENQEVSYQTTAENSYILVNDNIRIDLGLKKIYYDDEEKMSITQMTINGDENIEIVPEKEDDGENEGTGTDNTGNNQNDNTGNVQLPNNNPAEGEDNSGNNQDNEENQDDENSQNGNTGSGNGGTGNTNKANASIEMVEGEVGINNISARFVINDPDSAIKGNLVLHITNTDTGKRVYSIGIDKTQKEFFVGTSTLSPDANYILSINEENNGQYNTQYFQKLFRTDSMGIKLEKKYITSNSIAYAVSFENELVKSVTMTLYDKDYNAVSEPMVVTTDNSSVLFENLTSNTSYNLVVDNVIMQNFEYNKVYTINKTVMTLKKTPSLSGLMAKTDEESNTFTIGVDKVIDEDESIKKYYYYIYKADDINVENFDTIKPIKIITKDDSSNVTVNIDGQEIKNKVSYKYKVIAEYYDNEKYGEIETGLSNNFVLTEKPSVDFTLDEANTTFNKIVGTVKIKDASCTVLIKGRKCLANPYYSGNFELHYSGEGQNGVIENIKFDPETLEYKLELDGLLANGTYEFDLFGDVDYLDGSGIREGAYIGTFYANTTTTDILTVSSWTQNESTRQDLINVTAKITAKNENLANSMAYMTFNLYGGDARNYLNSVTKPEPIKTKTVSGDLKDEYYGRNFTLNTLNTFEITNTTVENEDGTTSIIQAIDILKSFTEDKLQRYYTLEITDIYDSTHQNEILIENNVFLFETPAILLIEDQLINPTITAEAIQNIDLESGDYDQKYSYSLADTTIVGYKVNITADLDKIALYFEGNKPVRELIYYVCDADKNKDCTVEDAIETQVIDLTENDATEAVFYLKNGTKYSVSDSSLTRGHNYIFKAKLNIDTDNDEIPDSYYPNKDVATDTKKAPKQSPSYTVYISETTEDKIIYKYNFIDVDNALYEQKIYYTIEAPSVVVPEEGEDTAEGEEVVEEAEELSVDLQNGQFELSGLSNGNVYSISFKKALYKTKSSIQDVQIGKYIFDGKYTYTKDTINFKNVIYENDNRLRIVIMEDESTAHLVDRISAYHIVLSADGVEDYERVYPTNAKDYVNTCEIDGVEYDCIVVDYADIEDFKTKDISVKVTAYYDTGIINNNFASLATGTTGYLLQNNNVYNEELKNASYIYLNEKGSNTLAYPSGIYDYVKNTVTSTGATLQIVNKIDLNTYTFAENNDSMIERTGIVFKNEGIYSSSDKSTNSYTINNKVLDKVELSTSNNKFKFNSIIPKITVTSTGLVNGAIINIKPIGLTEEKLKKEFKNEDGKYYFYLKIYKDAEKTELYREEKVEINTTSTKLELTKYMPNTTYYFEVYSYMLKDTEYKETLLFDSKYSSSYVSSTYSFSSLDASGILFKKTIKHTPYSEGDIYTKRNLEIEAKLNKNIGVYDVRFEYYDQNNNLLFEETLSPDITTSNSGNDSAKIVKDVTDFDLTFGKAEYYTLKIYIETEVYDSDEKAELLIYEGIENLPYLQKPTISFTTTSYENSLEFNVTITDKDKVIKDGEYCVELKDTSYNDVATPICGISILNSEYNGKFTFKNLTSDTLYIFRVYADYYMNNENLTTKDGYVEQIKTISTSTWWNVALGSTAAKGSNTSITLTFGSGVNLDKIRKIDYTIMKNPGTKVMSGTYTLGNGKNFEYDSEGNARLLINPSGLTLENNAIYDINIDFWVSHPNNPDDTSESNLVRLYDKTVTISVDQ